MSPFRFSMHRFCLQLCPCQQFKHLLFMTKCLLNQHFLNVLLSQGCIHRRMYHIKVSHKIHLLICFAKTFWRKCKCCRAVVLMFFKFMKLDILAFHISQGGGHRETDFDIREQSQVTCSVFCIRSVYFLKVLTCNKTDFFLAETSCMQNTIKYFKSIC